MCVFDASLFWCDASQCTVQPCNHYTLAYLFFNFSLSVASPTLEIELCNFRLVVCKFFYFTVHYNRCLAFSIRSQSFTSFYLESYAEITHRHQSFDQSHRLYTRVYRVLFSDSLSLLHSPFAAFTSIDSIQMHSFNSIQYDCMISRFDSACYSYHTLYSYRCPAA